MPQTPGAGREETQGDSAPHTMPVVEETASVETRTVPTGIVRVSKHVEQHTESLQIPISRQVVEIRRVRRGEEIVSIPSTRAEGDTLIIPVVEEEVIVTKRLVLREEIHVITRHVQETVERDIALVKEEVTVDRLDAEAHHAPASGPGRKTTESP